MIDIYNKTFLAILSLGLGIGMAIATIIFCHITNKEDNTKPNKDGVVNDGQVADVFAKEMFDNQKWKVK